MPSRIQEEMKRTLVVFTALLTLTLTGCGQSKEDLAIQKQIAADQARVAKCDAMRAKAKEMSDYSSNLAKEARSLQLVWITNEMKRLKDSGKISAADWDVFSVYAKPGITPPRLPGGDIDLLMKRVINQGLIKPYLPKDVVDLGTKAALSPNSATYEVNFPECFSEVEFIGIKMLADLKPQKGTWADRIVNPTNLIP